MPDGLWGGVTVISMFLNIYCGGHSLICNVLALIVAQESVRSVIGWLNYSSCKRSGLPSCHVQM